MTRYANNIISYQLSCRNWPSKICLGCSFVSIFPINSPGPQECYCIVQDLRLPSLLLSPRPAHLTRHEAEDQVSCDWSRAVTLTSHWSLGRSGQYEFPKPEWTSVSEECKSLIRKCLRTNPDERPSIDQVIESKWISVNTLRVPQFGHIFCKAVTCYYYKVLLSTIICPNCH